jgi:tetratricopeptide (TPR) repeat protein
MTSVCRANRVGWVGSAPPRAVLSLGMGVLLALLPATPLQAQDDPFTADFEGELAFVTASAEATRLFNVGQYTEALDRFLQLEANYPGSDTDGFVALSIGDCYQALGLYDQARQQYEAVQAAHPELADRLRDRLFDIAMETEVPDAMIEDLRIAFYEAGTNNGPAAWRLARALQQHARSLLQEAAETFRQASADQTIVPGAKFLRKQALLLDSLKDDLTTVINRVERIARGAPLCEGRAAALPEGQIVSPGKVVARWTAVTSDGEQIEFEIEREDRCGPVAVRINGRPVELDDNYKVLIQHHGERISALLLEAADAANTPTAGTQVER